MSSDLEENNQSTQNHRKINTSMVISFIAVVVSCLTMFISIIETNIMKEQQEIMREQQNLLVSQKAASVWPYLQIRPSITYNNEKDNAVYVFEIVNKGVGPAILGDVEYMFDDKDVESYGLVRELKKKYPDIEFEYRSNAQIDSLVISAGEKIVVNSFEVQNIGEKENQVEQILNRINFSCNMCYCSIYSDCWRLDYGRSRKDDTCENRTDIN